LTWVNAKLRNAVWVRFPNHVRRVAPFLSPNDWTQMLIPLSLPPMSHQLTQPNIYRDSGSSAAWAHTPTWIRKLGECIRQHESRHNYRSKNHSSSASGAYQFLTLTWRGNAKWVAQATNYETANKAPRWVQDLVFVHSIQNGGMHNWIGTHCGYGT